MNNIQPQVETKINYKFYPGLLEPQPLDLYGCPMESTPNILGRRITIRLTVLGKNQTWLADEMVLTNEAISAWIRGRSRPRGINLEKLATVLLCSQGYLTGDYEDDDIAAVVDMMLIAPPEKRKEIRKISAVHLEPDGAQLRKGKPRKDGGRRG